MEHAMTLNSIRLLAALLCCASTAISCRKSESTSAGGKDAPITGSPKDAPVAIAPAWKSGSKYVMRLESQQSMQLPNFGGGRGQQRQTNNAPIDTVFAQDYTLTVTNADGGNRGMEMEILGLELQASRGEETFINFDSQNKAAPRDNNQVVDALEKLVGGKVHFLITADNQVTKTEGLEALLARVEPATNNAAAGRRGLRGGMGGMWRNMYNDGVLKQMIELAGAPPQAVKIGESWPVSRETTAPMIGKLLITTTNTLRGWQEHDGAKCARVEFTGTITVGGRDTNATGLRLGIENGRLNGRYWYDPAIGLPRESVIDQEYKVSAGGFGGRGMNNPARTNAAPGFSASTKQTVSVKLVELKPAN